MKELTVLSCTAEERGSDNNRFYSLSFGKDKELRVCQNTGDVGVFFYGECKEVFKQDEMRIDEFILLWVKMQKTVTI